MGSISAHCRRGARHLAHGHQPGGGHSEQQAEADHPQHQTGRVSQIVGQYGIGEVGKQFPSAEKAEKTRASTETSSRAVAQLPAIHPKCFMSPQKLMGPLAPSD